jgi:hypothetical protein
VAGKQRGQQAFNISGGELFRQLLDRQFAQRPRMAQALELGTRRLGVFDDEMAQAAGRLTRRRRQEVFPGGIAQRHRQQPESAAHGRQGRARPALRSMSHSAISGRPIRALGSSPRM